MRACRALCALLPSPPVRPEGVKCVALRRRWDRLIVEGGSGCVKDQAFWTVGVGSGGVEAVVVVPLVVVVVVER